MDWNGQHHNRCHHLHFNTFERSSELGDALSVSTEFIVNGIENKTFIHQDEFHVNNEPVATCLFKKVMWLISMDSMTTVSLIQETLMKIYLPSITTSRVQ